MNLASPAVPLTSLPAGFGLDLDSNVKQLARDAIAGGVPYRILRLSASGVRAWESLQRGVVRTPAEGMLARRLTDAGFAHPVPPATRELSVADVCVVVPVLDRAGALARCLAGLGRSARVVVVDDGSVDPAAIAAVAVEHGAALVRCDVNAGPAAARNRGLVAAESTGCRIVAFVDSDCIPADGWLDTLLGHFADPLVAAVAPRIVATSSTTWAGRYTQARANLDLGARPSRVRPDARVAYVPSAALVVRVSALHDLASAGHAFDPALRVGEDVDLVWRLDARGWRVRYEPRCRVVHEDPDTWPALLRRRFRYGTAAAPLALAHPDASAPLALSAWPTLTVLAALARRPLPAVAAYAASAAVTAMTLRRARLPTAGLLSATTQAVQGTGLGVGRYVTQFAGPVAAAGVLTPGRASRRLAAALLVLAGPALAWWPRRTALDPLRFCAGYLADEVAYGAGVWTGCVRTRSGAPLRPRVSYRSLLPPSVLSSSAAAKAARSHAILSAHRPSVAQPVTPAQSEGVTP